ncbi:hypothetical protein [Saccharibacillus sp. O23]|uniref:hypothetical protein n=1 Tax=Saccharibacillus sp. O23 TaxID=2009338 RepID=UPI00117B871B|nr:hypothetical protein [Saccharibacillus sp. O23]
MNFLQRIKDGAGRASERAQSAVEIGRLNSHISDIQREIDVHLLRMGQVFYDNYRNPDTAPAEEEIMDLCTACDLLNEEILELRARIAELRSERLCECGARLDIDAESCPHCGRRFVEGEEPAQVEAPAAPTEHVIPAVQLRKPDEQQHVVEAEEVHNLAGRPGFERQAEQPAREERAEVRTRRTEPEEVFFEDDPEEEVRTYERETWHERPDSRTAEDDEDEQFATKRYELGATDVREPDAVYETAAAAGAAASAVRNPDEETQEEREERQRRELREIRIRERRKMKEEQQREREPDASRSEPSDFEREEEPAEPAQDLEYERRQRERIEREKERQDELDRLIASWNGGISGSDDDSEEKFVVRRPSGEVVRCQVCGSGLPKGSKWCPHCASEQI